MPAGTHDQITHTDVNVTGHDCNFCHTQVGPLDGAPASQGKEWAQAKFHANFTAANPLVMNGTTGRCSNCHLNVKPGAGFAAQDHSALHQRVGQRRTAARATRGRAPARPPRPTGSAPPAACRSYITVGGFPIPAAAGRHGDDADRHRQPAAPDGGARHGLHHLPRDRGGRQGRHRLRPRLDAHQHQLRLLPRGGQQPRRHGVERRDHAPPPAPATRGPYTLTSVVATKGGSKLTVTYPNHFYPVDCYQCHSAPSGIGDGHHRDRLHQRVDLPAHDQSKMTNPSTCVMCHTNGIPN